MRMNNCHFSTNRKKYYKSMKKPNMVLKKTQPKYNFRHPNFLFIFWIGVIEFVKLRHNEWKYSDSSARWAII